jgi:hypothetical protein
MSDPNTDRYSIEIKNLTTGEIVILTAVDMTDDEKSVVVRQLLRLSGAPAALWIENPTLQTPIAVEAAVTSGQAKANQREHFLH